MSARLHVFMIAGALQCYVLLLFRVQFRVNTEQCSCWSFTAMCTLFGCGKSAVKVNLDVYACTNVALFSFRLRH